MRRTETSGTLVLTVLVGILIVSSPSGRSNGETPSPSVAGAGRGPHVVRVVKGDGGFQLLRDGKPYFIKGAGGDGPRTEVRDVVELATARSVERALAVNADVVTDTPPARLALRCFHVFSIEATHAWLRGDATRAQVEALLATALRDLLVHTIPALQP